MEKLGIGWANFRETGQGLESHVGKPRGMDIGG